MQLINQRQLNCAVLRDFNINRLPSVIAYNNMLTSFSFFHIISVPTRLTTSSATLIDYILTNLLYSNITPGVVRYDISNYFPIYTIFSNFQKKKVFQKVFSQGF